MGEAPGLRAARPDDAPALAELVNFAGEGLPLYLWGKMAEAGQTAWDVGRIRAARDAAPSPGATPSSPSRSGTVAACLMGYSLPEAAPPIDLVATPAMFVPLGRSWSVVRRGSWYVNVLATYPDHGAGGALVPLFCGVADRLARGNDRLRGCSIIVADSNTGGRRLLRALRLWRDRARPDGQGRLGRAGRRMGPVGQGRPASAWGTAAYRFSCRRRSRARCRR